MAQLQLKAKIIIDAILTVKTGLHIGGSDDYAPIGAVDSPVIRDPYTKQPVIPGSSVKGKMRTLLAKARSDTYILSSCDKDNAVVKRLFGAASSGENNDECIPSRLQFSNSFITDESVEEYKILGTDTYLGEIKAENTIDRLTGKAMPRSIERVPRGMKFNFRLVYNLENEKNSEECEKHFKEDQKAIIDAFKLLQLDYLGGHGSRGYGRIEFSRFKVTKLDTSNFESTKMTNFAEALEGTRL